MTLATPRLRLATVWLAGCSGCHMSLLDLDDWLFELARFADVVYSPIASDCKVFPDNVDVVLVEGAVAGADHLALAQRLRRCSRLVVALGDCAVTGNVSALRNLCPGLQERVLPLQAVIPVDLFVPGCPPSADRIRSVIEPLLHGRCP
jgi:NAD-reducing hydrogenase small subunit